MELFLEPGAGRRTTRLLFEQVRDGIVSGRFPAGTRLPPSRLLAAQLGVARATVTTVYGRLAAEGFVVGRAGAGTVVAEATTPGRAATPRTPSLPGRRSIPGAVRFDLRPGTPDLGLFPMAAWRRCARHALDAPLAGYGEAGGEPELRRVIARWIGTSRGVVADPEQVLVTSGAQHAIDVVTRALLRAGDAVALEEPGYPPVRRLLQASGFRVVPVAVDGEGLRVADLPAGVRAVYVTPSHQYPTGATLSFDRRRALLAHAERHGTLIIEDDYDSEFRHVDRPLEPLHRLDRAGRVVYVGTFSKVLAPSLRLGFAVLPAAAVADVVAFRALGDLQPAVPSQRALAAFMADGHLDRHLRRARRVYRARHDAVQAFVTAQHERRRLVPLARSVAGLHVAAALAADVEEVAVTDRAARLGIALGTYADCWAGTVGSPGLVIGFGSVDDAGLAGALGLLDGVVRRAVRAHRRTSS